MSVQLLDPIADVSVLEPQLSAVQSIQRIEPPMRKKVRVKDMPKVIGLSGVARCGKDSFLRGLIDAYPELRIHKLSIGDIIRTDVAPFIQQNFGVDIFTCSDAQKEAFRPLLAWYGNIRRQHTNGMYFIVKLDDVIRTFKDKVDVFVVPDIRFKEYPFDETDWVTTTNHGILVHLTRILPNGEQLLPPNDFERLNDPRVRAKSTHVIQWPTFSDKSEITKFVKELGIL